MYMNNNNILRTLKYNNSMIIPYYIVGSDHYNWTKIDKNGKIQDDTLKILTQNMRLLITGVLGFVGEELVHFFNRKSGYSILGIDKI